MISELSDALEYVHRAFDERGIWHCLAYGTLLGAVRDRTFIEWDYDFDLFVQPRDWDRIVQMSADTIADGIRFEPVSVPGLALAVNPTRVSACSGSAIGVWRDDRKLADLYAFTLFDDGVLRRFDLAQEAYWVPHSSFAHFFVERLETATLGARQYPAPQHAERLLADTYGDDWRIPYRAERQGGVSRPGATVHGDRYAPHLDDQIAYCEASGWDRSKYQHEYAWPRTIRAAGPIGPTGRTAETSRALWWRSRDELIALY